jgi:hypothetical protein
MPTRNNSGIVGVLIIFQRIPLELYRPTFDPRSGRVICLGRIFPEERSCAPVCRVENRAIEIPRICDAPLKIVTEVDDLAPSLVGFLSAFCSRIIAANLSGFPLWWCVGRESADRPIDAGSMVPRH